MVLPFAVSGEANSVREFKISGRTDGCASLLDPVRLLGAVGAGLTRPFPPTLPS